MINNYPTKVILFAAVVLQSISLAAQTPIEDQIKKVELRLNEIPNASIFKSLSDLDNDGDDDFIFFYQCGEANCIEVFISENNTRLKKVIDEKCYGYKIWQLSKSEKEIKLELGECCGESPFLSHRAYGFNRDEATLKENYITFNSSYAKEGSELFPQSILSKPYQAIILNNGYNVRYSPEITKVVPQSDATFFTCEESSNVIAKLKINSVVVVIADFQDHERRWLFIEAENKDIIKCSDPFSFDYADQKLRGWISGNYVKYLE